MSKHVRIALVGDYNPSVTAHRAIPLSLELAAQHHRVKVEGVWLHTSGIGAAERTLRNYGGVWCVPASPYANTQAALDAIRVARDRLMPFLGTCGGFQHALLEYARNVLGLLDADHAETNPQASLPLIAPLTCSLVEKEMEIVLAEGSLLCRSYGTPRIVEGYRCSYGPNPKYERELFGGPLHVTARDADGEVPRRRTVRASLFRWNVVPARAQELGGTVATYRSRFCGSDPGRLARAARGSMRRALH